jgi:F0F1-type ATP synthase assembly protein I
MTGYIDRGRGYDMDLKSLKNLAYLTQVAFLMLTPIIGGVYIGQWLDQKWDTSPWFLFLGIVLGVGAGFMSLYKFVMKVTKDSDSKKHKGDE